MRSFLTPQSGEPDLNRRSLDPQSSVLAILDYRPLVLPEGFEPSLIWA